MSGSALLIESKNSYTALIADRELIRSMLFRMFHLKGKGLHFIKPFFEKDDERTKTTIRVFQIDWKSFLKEINETDSH